MANKNTYRNGAGKKTDRIGAAGPGKFPLPTLPPESTPVELPGGSNPPSTLPQPSLRAIPRLSGELAAEESMSQTAAGGGPYFAAAQTGEASSAADAAPLRAAVEFAAPEEDAEARLRYESALERLETLGTQRPGYTSRYDAQIRDLCEQITGRGPFRYDSATDPLYQQVRQSYIRQGDMAMRDTMGQAAALTGGYGSSYAQSVGQQQYDAYLRRLADVLPETYGMALEAWRAEGQDLKDRYSAATAMEKSDYERYLDELGQYDRAVDLARSGAESAYERMIAGDERAYSRAADDYARRLGADKLDYQRRQDAYSRLTDLLAAGYAPSAEEYAAAGLSRSQGEALRAQLAPAQGGYAVRSEKEKTEEKNKGVRLSGTRKGAGDLSKSVKKR